MSSNHYSTILYDDQKKLLRSGMESLSLDFNNNQLEMLLTYSALLERWNKAYNLTSIKNPIEIIKLHILDSLAINPFLEGNSFIDIGTGAGLPGIPLAILNPDRHFTLLDSNGKKTRFLFQVKLDLGLSNINEVNERAAEFKPNKPFDCVLSRAFSSLKDMITNCEHLTNQNGSFLAMKARISQSELSEVNKNYKVDVSSLIKVPGFDGERHVVKITKNS